MRSVLSALFVVFLLFFVSSCANSQAYAVAGDAKCAGSFFVPGAAVKSCELFDVGGVAVGVIEVSPRQAGNQFCTSDIWFVRCVGERGSAMPAMATSPICPVIDDETNGCYNRWKRAQSGGV